MFKETISSLTYIDRSGTESNQTNRIRPSMYGEAMNISKLFADREAHFLCSVVVYAPKIGMNGLNVHMNTKEKYGKETSNEE